MSLEAANREVCLLLKEGIKVSVPDRERTYLAENHFQRLSHFRPQMKQGDSMKSPRRIWLEFTQNMEFTTQ